MFCRLMVGCVFCGLKIPLQEVKLSINMVVNESKNGLKTQLDRLSYRYLSSFVSCNFEMHLISNQFSLRDGKFHNDHYRNLSGVRRFYTFYGK